MQKSVLWASGIVIEGTRVLLARRDTSVEYAGSWDFPGAAVETGEDPRQTVARALREASVAVAVGDIVEATFFRRAPTRSVILLFYEAMRLTPGTPLPESSRATLRWADAEEIEVSDFPPDDAAIVKKVSARLLSATWSTT